jgi:nucleoid-associated protein YgaU
MNIRTNLKSGSACYTVQSGDSLSTIAYQFYGDMSGASVSKIYFSNMATIGSNPNILQPGQVLYIPD